jgi:DNA-binding LacI/PurR family transcriptional regulator
MRKPPNILAVAKAAGVAASTVSRALNGGYVSPELKAHIERVIKKLGYRPWSTARNFKLGRSGSIGVVVENSQGAWFPKLLAGIESELRAHHLSVQLGSLDLDGAYDSSMVSSWIVDRRVDGLIFVRPGAQERSLIVSAKRARLPVALIGPDEDFGFGQVLRSHNKSAGRAVAEHLLALGHRRIGFVGGPPSSRDSQERLQGLRDGLQVARLELHPDNVLFARHYDAEDGKQFATKWLKWAKTRAPTAIVFGNDSLALGFLREVQTHGVEVPREVSVVGFDDVPEAALHWPGLTTARQQMRELGAAACKSVLRHVLDDLTSELPPSEFQMPVVVRESTGAPGRR